MNALAPDICPTEGLAALVEPAERKRWREIVPLGPAGDPDDVAGAAVLLASDLSRSLDARTAPPALTRPAAREYASGPCSTGSSCDA